jgi:hypothetical protein
MEMYPRSRHASPHDDDYDDTRDLPDRDPRTRYVSKKHSIRTWLFLLGVVTLVIGIGLLTYVFNSATITITPKFQDVDVKRTLTLGDADGIPFIIATSSLSSKKVLQATEAKKIESKASGYIIIYNKFSDQPQRLIKNTRFESASGKIYRISESVVVPGMKGDKPGSVRSLVYADGYGNEYNSDPTDFTVPGFKDSPRYAGFFGRSDGAISGGASGDVSLASLADINAAKDELAIELTQKIKDALSSKKMEGYAPLYSSIQVSLKDNEKEMLSGKTATYEVTATGHLLLADVSKLSSLLASEVRDYKNEPVTLEDQSSLTFTVNDQARLDYATSVKVLTEGQVRIVWLTDHDALKKQFAGKNRSEYRTIMNNISSIQGGEIGFSPMWLSAFPTDLTKIKVIEKLPKR